jgi:hypothetical protein
MPYGRPGRRERDAPGFPRPNGGPEGAAATRDKPDISLAGSTGSGKGQSPAAAREPLPPAGPG